MEKINQLEQIFWKEGKFVNEENVEVKPKPIGNPIFISKEYENADLISNQKMVKYLITNNSEYEMLNSFTQPIINAYSKGEMLDASFKKNFVEQNGAIPVQFYKI